MERHNCPLCGHLGWTDERQGQVIKGEMVCGRCYVLHHTGFDIRCRQ